MEIKKSFQKITQDSKGQVLMRQTPFLFQMHQTEEVLVIRNLQPIDIYSNIVMSVSTLQPVPKEKREKRRIE
jgi:hypothetical protein